MAFASVGELDLYYETFGEPADDPVLLVAGLGAQCLSWPDGFCEGLADRALHVIRFDNRDIGLSTKLDHLPFDLGEMLAAIARGEVADPPYRLDDMAADAVGLLDSLGIDAAHLVGMSLGGMVAQLAAINRPDRVRTLTSLMSTTGNPAFGRSSPEARHALMSPPAAGRDEAVARSIDQRRIWGSPDQIDETALAEHLAILWDRDHHPDGSRRQFGAAFAASDREPALRDLRVPTLVLHGTRDTLIDPDGGVRTAEVIPGARLVLIDGMGHDLPSSFWAPVIEAIVSLVIGTRP